MKQSAAETESLEKRLQQITTEEWRSLDLPVRRNANLFAALLVLTILGLTALFLRLNLEQARQRATTSAQNLAQVIEGQMREKFAKVDVSLQSSVMEVKREIRQYGKINATEFTAFLTQQSQLLPDVSYYRATDAQGTLRYGPGAQVGELVNVSDRAYFQQLRDGPAATDSVVFGPLIGKVSKVWSVGVAHRLRNPHGEFAGVVFAAIRVDEIQKALEVLDLGRFGAATMRMTEMALVARSPRPALTGDAGIGSVRVSPELINAIRANPDSGTYVAKTAIDQIERRNAYARVGNYGAYIIVGRATDDYMSAWIRESYGTVAFALLALTATLVAAAFYNRSLALHRAAVERVKRSEADFRQFVEQNSSVILLIDPLTGALIDANAAASKYYGYARDTLKRMSIHQINTLAPEKVEKTLATIAQGERHTFDFHHRLASGEVRDVEAHVTPLRLGERMISFALVHDVTDRNSAVRNLLESEERYARVIQGVGEGYWEMDLRTQRLVVSPRYEKMLGFEPRQFDATRKGLQKMIHPDDLGRADRCFDELVSGAVEQYQCEYRLITADGRVIWIHSRARIMRWHSDGSPSLASGTHADITPRKAAEDALRVMNKDFTALLDFTTDFIYFKDSQGRIRFCSQTLAELNGQKSWRDMIGKNAFDLHPQDVAQRYQQEDDRMMSDGIAILNKVHPFNKKDGSAGWASTSKWPIYGADGTTISGVFGISRDISDLKRIEDELRMMASTDFLTGVQTRRAFLNDLERELSRIQRTPSERGALLMFDLDHFKIINDTHGHAVGDLVLQHVTRLIGSAMRKVDSIGRLGGEEFAMLMPTTDITAAMTFAERLRVLVADTPLKAGDVTVAVTISIGLTALTQGDRSGNPVLERADRAMYLAKNTGRNRVQVDIGS